MQLTDLRSAQHEEMDKLRQVHREAVEKVLTAEQREKIAVLNNEAFYGGKLPAPNAVVVPSLL